MPDRIRTYDFLDLNRGNIAEWKDCHHDTTFSHLHLPFSSASQVFGSKRDCEQLRCIAQWTRGTLGVSIKDGGKGGHFSLCLSHDPFHRTKIAPVSLDYESVRTGLSARQHLHCIDEILRPEC